MPVGEREDSGAIEKLTDSFKLSKLSKGTNWEIKIYDDDLESLKKKVKEMHEWAFNEFGAGNE